MLGLVAVVAVASTGSVPGGSSSSRPPSETFLDTIFTLWIVAVVAGGILLVYGLLQRQAIAKQIALGRYPPLVRPGLRGALRASSTVGYWALRQWKPHGQEPPDEGHLRRRQAYPDHTGGDTVTQYEPSVSWLPIAAVIALVGVAVIAYVVSGRRSRRARDPRGELARDLADALDDALDDLRAEADPRRAIIAAYARLEKFLAANGVARDSLGDFRRVSRRACSATSS